MSRMTREDWFAAVAFGLAVLFVLGIVLWGCRIDGDEVEADVGPEDACEPGDADCIAERQQACRDEAIQPCTDWDAGLVWCCSPFCDYGCEGGGCGTGYPYCNGCMCP